MIPITYLFFASSSVKPDIMVLTAQRRSMNVTLTLARMEELALILSTLTNAPAPEEHRVSQEKIPFEINFY